MAGKSVRMLLWMSMNIQNRAYGETDIISGYELDVVGSNPTMPTIYGAGLPRTGTTTLAKALEILGYDVTHYCPITNPSTLDQQSLDYEAYVASNLLINADLTKGKWIVLTPPDRWEESMYYMGADICDYQQHMKELEKIQKLNQPNILHFYINDGWPDLCKFLGHEIPDIEFPWLNGRE
jgi:Sulfotransferase domain